MGAACCKPHGGEDPAAATYETNNTHAVEKAPSQKSFRSAKSQRSTKSNSINEMSKELRLSKKLGMICVDSTASSITVSWPATPHAERYILQYRIAGVGGTENDFETLSETLSVPQARKRNLIDQDNFGFWFRAGAIFHGEVMPDSWLTHTKPFRLLPYADDQRRMEAPKVFLGGRYETLLVTWKKAVVQKFGIQHGENIRYELQMRENKGGAAWTTIAAEMAATEVRKKNLNSKSSYQFRMRPVLLTVMAGNRKMNLLPFSPPSEPSVALGLHRDIREMFAPLHKGAQLLEAGTYHKEVVSLVDGLGGKEFILVYASAKKIGSGRESFLPQLKSFYNSLPGGPKHRLVEVVFLSADLEHFEFKHYYGLMPWLAVDYLDGGRKQILQFLQLDQEGDIPKLIVLDNRTGRILDENAIGKPLSIDLWRKLAATLAREEEGYDDDREHEYEAREPEFHYYQADYYGGTYENERNTDASSNYVFEDNTNDDDSHIYASRYTDYDKPRGFDAESELTHEAEPLPENDFDREPAAEHEEHYNYYDHENEQDGGDDDFDQAVPESYKDHEDVDENEHEIPEQELDDEYESQPPHEESQSSEKEHTREIDNPAISHDNDDDDDQNDYYPKNDYDVEDEEEEEVVVDADEEYDEYSVSDHDENKDHDSSSSGGYDSSNDSSDGNDDDTSDHYSQHDDSNSQHSTSDQDHSERSSGFDHSTGNYVK